MKASRRRVQPLTPSHLHFVLISLVQITNLNRSTNLHPATTTRPADARKRSYSVCSSFPFRTRAVAGTGTSTPSRHQAVQADRAPKRAQPVNLPTLPPPPPLPHPPLLPRQVSHYILTAMAHHQRRILKPYPHRYPHQSRHQHLHLVLRLRLRIHPPTPLRAQHRRCLFLPRRRMPLHACAHCTHLSPPSATSWHLSKGI
jgi:hypothetical protein